MDVVHLLPRAQAGVHRIAAKLRAQTIREYIANELSKPGIRDVVEGIESSLWSKISDGETKEASDPPPFRVCFLGTSSAIPTKYRNGVWQILFSVWGYLTQILSAVTGIWVRYSADGGPNLASSVLLDAGEGTLAQLAECCDEASSMAPGVLYSSLGEVSKGVHDKAAEVLIVAAFRRSRA